MISIFWLFVFLFLLFLLHQNLSKRQQASQTDLEKQLEILTSELQQAKERIEVLEKIVTDENYELNQKIGKLDS